MMKFSEIFAFSKEKFRKIPILKEVEWFEWFEWFGPSPIEPFNSGQNPSRLALRAFFAAGRAARQSAEPGGPPCNAVASLYAKKCILPKSFRSCLKMKESIRERRENYKKNLQNYNNFL